MPDFNNEADLIQAMLQRNEAAYHFAVRRYSGGMLASARQMLDAASAEDVVQETWVAVIDALAKFEGRSSLQTWLNTITLNRSKNRLRKGWRETLVDFQGGLEPALGSRFIEDGHWGQPPTSWDSGSPQLELEGEALQGCLEKHLDALPDGMRAAIRMRDLELLEVEEICNILQVTASNFRVMLHRARQRIYLMIEHFQETGQC